MTPDEITPPQPWSREPSMEVSAVRRAIQPLLEQIARRGHERADDPVVAETAVAALRSVQPKPLTVEAIRAAIQSANDAHEDDQEESAEEWAESLLDAQSLAVFALAATPAPEPKPFGDGLTAEDWESAPAPEGE